MLTHSATPLSGPVSRRWWMSLSEPQPDGPPPDLHDPTIRRDLVERVRTEIAAGVYETPEKLEAALERFLRRQEEQG